MISRAVVIQVCITGMGSNYLVWNGAKVASNKTLQVGIILQKDIDKWESQDGT